MKILNNENYFNGAEIALKLGIDKKDLYYIIRKDTIWSKNSSIAVLPKGVIIGKSRYFIQKDVDQFERFFKILKGKKYKIAYDMLKEEMLLERVNIVDSYTIE